MSSTTRLFVITNTLDRGGTERHLLQVLPRLVGQGYAVEVFCLYYAGALADDLRKAGIPVHGRKGKPAYPALRPLLYLISSFGLLGRLLSRRPDIVHFFLPAAYIIGLPLAVLTGCRVRIMSRRSLNHYHKTRRWAGVVERLWHRFAQALVGNAASVVDQLREEGVPEGKLWLINNGIDLSAFRNVMPSTETRRAFGLDERHFVIAIVANLIRYKGHVDLLEALALVRADLPPDWVLLCAGRDNGIGAQLQEKAVQLGIDQHIRWLGSVENIPALLACADIGVLSSHEEGFSNAIIEYMASGLPVVATDAGGNGEAVSSETGLIVPARNPVQLGNALRLLASDAALRQSMGAAGRYRAQQLYSLEVCVEAYRELYRKTGQP